MSLRKKARDAILSVTPYYNKPTPEGTFLHFSEVVRYLDIPLVFYNVPGRTGTNISVDTQLRLAGVDNIVGVKGGQRESGSDHGSAEAAARRVPGPFGR